jgi:hypothetical protein
MENHPENPSSNAIGGGVSEDSLKKAISDSGYPLQAVVADQLRKTFEASKIDAYLIQEEWPYLDGDTGTVPGLRPKYFRCSRGCDEPGDGGEQVFVIFRFADGGGDAVEAELAA